jgi:membrane-associated phospholipid phosphatase
MAGAQRELATLARSALPMSMGVERVAYGGHYLSDVAFGALLNWFLLLAAAMLMRIRLPDRGPPGPH